MYEKFDSASPNTSKIKIDLLAGAQKIMEHYAAQNFGSPAGSIQGLNDGITLRLNQGL